MICLWSEADGYPHSHFKSKWSEAWKVLSLWFSLWDKHGSLHIFPCYFNNSSNCHYLFLTCFSQRLSPQTPCLAQAPSQPHCSFQSLTRRRRHWNNMARREHSIDVSKYTFFPILYWLVTFGHYLTRNGKVSCILVTISDWFPNKKI